MTETTLTPFRIDIPEADVTDLRDRLARTRFTPEPPPSDNDYGVAVDRVRDLVSSWLDWDWRAAEAELNTLPQFTTIIDGQSIHLVHLESSRSDAVPLLLTHGWPGTFVEFTGVARDLAEPPEGMPAFHVVIPSIPGFGFSGPTSEPGWNSRRVASAWLELMTRLGYERFLAHGNDLGSAVTPELGRQAPDRLIGVHVNQIYAFPSGEPGEMDGLTPEEYAQLALLQDFYENKMAYNNLHSTQPQNIAHALADSPTGQLAWSSQLLGPDCDPDFVLMNVAITWFTQTSASGMRIYWEDQHDPDAQNPPKTTTPLALAAWAGDFNGIRRFAEKLHGNIVRWTTHDRGGHYPSAIAPDLFVDDIRGFAAQLAEG